MICAITIYCYYCSNESQYIVVWRYVWQNIACNCVIIMQKLCIFVCIFCDETGREMNICEKINMVLYIRHCVEKLDTVLKNAKLKIFDFCQKWVSNKILSISIKSQFYHMNSVK